MKKVIFSYCCMLCFFTSLSAQREIDWSIGGSYSYPLTEVDIDVKQRELFSSSILIEVYPRSTSFSDFKSHESINLFANAKKRLSSRWSIGGGVGLTYNRYSISVNLSYLQNEDYQNLFDIAKNIDIENVLNRRAVFDSIAENTVVYTQNFKENSTVFYANLTFSEWHFDVVKNKFSLFVNGNLGFLLSRKTRVTSTPSQPANNFPEATYRGSNELKNIQLDVGLGFNYKITKSLETRASFQKSLMNFYNSEPYDFTVKRDAISIGLAYYMTTESKPRKRRNEDFKKSFGLEINVGGTLSTLRKYKPRSFNRDIRPTLQYSIGIEPFLKLSPNFKLQTGLQYEVRGIKSKIEGLTVHYVDDVLVVLDTLYGQSRLKTTYLSAPLKIRYEWGEKFGFFVSSGIKFSYLAFTKLNIDWPQRLPDDPYTTFSEDKEYKNERERLSNYDLGITFGLGGMYKLNDRYHFAIGAEYSHGMIELGTKYFWEKSYFGLNGDVKSQVLQLNGSIIYNF